MANKQNPLPVAERHSRFNDFYSLAFGDYLAARKLLLAELLPQGAGMAATAVEKIFKAILSIRGENLGGHLKKALIRSIENYQPALFSQLRPDFLEFLVAAYDLRYLDNLSSGSSLVLSKYRMLAEIDRTMCIIFSGLQLKHGELTRVLPFEEAKIQKNALLMEENYFIEDGSTARYFEQQNFVQEIKVFGPYESLNVTYRTAAGSDAGSFLKAANFRLKEPGVAGQLSGG